VYFLLLMADGRRLQGKLLDRLTLESGGRTLAGQARLSASGYDPWLAYPVDRAETEGGKGRDHPEGVPSPDERAGPAF
jgi:hypothetical protein